ncbi:unnamed protein product [Candidula unifasciata]|uniref:Ubiquitin-like domain-containing protein n=1 Tax=Candidula unifasciata TaxID=100452 RepID=A0A8S3YPQ6_9EUPU|nr:unnamed protein product [Candidula unifasciata]
MFRSTQYITIIIKKRQNLEAEPYIRVEFNLERVHGTCTIHEADCGIGTVISGLKDDLSHVFGLSGGQQRWLYNSTELQDSSTLEEYGISAGSTPKPQINVKIM